MKYLLGILLSAIFTTAAFAQPNKFVGIWEGDLNAGMQQLRLVFNITRDESGKLSAAMQSPRQSVTFIPADTIFTSEDVFFIEMRKFNISFSGKLVNDSNISGKFTQGQPFDLQLKKVEKATAVNKPQRPQTPKPPFPYKSLDISFTNKDQSIKFGATLSLPDTSGSKKYPAVVLITGSGAQDRDETIFGHKPFAVIADHLTKQGFAVLRVDDRGVGRSTGNFSKSTSADFANDTEAALDYLLKNKFIDPKNVGLIGHSEGGQIAPMVAARRKEVKFIVLLAGPGLTGAEVLATQNTAIYQAGGVSKAAAFEYGVMYFNLALDVVKAKDSAQALQNALDILRNWHVADTVKKQFNLATEAGIQAFAKPFVKELYTPWFRFFVNYDPAPVLKKLSCAVLALNGSQDLQVISEWNLNGIRNALAQSKTKNYEIKEIPQLNHLFQTCKKCTLDEYASLEESFSPAALDIMTGWLLKQVN